MVDIGIRQTVARGRVLAEVRVPIAKPEGEPASPSAIAVAQGAVLSRLPNGHFRLVRRFETVPFLALEVDADALNALEGMGDVVARVLPDRPMSPTPGR